MTPSVRTALSVALVSALVGPVLGAAPSTASPVRVTAERSSSEITRVVVISVDGLNPEAIAQLGEDGAPTFHRLVAEGVSTLNARSEVELTLTLPNHTSMVTGRRIVAKHGGHGVTWNDDRRRPRTVRGAAGHRVRSVFSSLASAGLGSAVFAAKEKFSLFERSWPQGIDRTVIRDDNSALVRAVQRDLVNAWRPLTFVHISLPDVAGHDHGFMSPTYVAAVHASDALVGSVLATISETADSLDHTLVVVTSDHGGLGPDHYDPRNYAHIRVPFLVWGPGVPAGVDLYDLNATYADPGTRRVRYEAKRQPVRNGVVGNLVLDVLGLPPIPHSEHNAAQDLDVFAD